MKNASVKSFITSISVILILMIVSYGLTFIIPAGTFERIINEDGKEIINTTSAFMFTEGGISFFKFIASPILVLTSSSSTTIIGILIFLIILGGAFNTLNDSGLMKYMLDKLTYKYIDKKYKLLSLVILLFMSLGSLIGSFEEVVPMVPICTALAINLGFDSLVGLSISLLAVGCGFAAGVFNPFTVGISQSLAQLPIFSGVSMRLVSFILIYLLLNFFVLTYAKKIEKNVNKLEINFSEDKQLSKGLLAFEIIIGIGVCIILSSSFIKIIQDYSIIIVALVFLIAGIVCPLIIRMKHIFKSFINGIVSMLPAVIMILLASSIRYILEEAKVLDTILYYAINTASNMNKYVLILFIYLIVLVMNFFIASGSAKAFMLIPLIVPLAKTFGLSSQLCVLAYAFGDGFSNVFYATNPVLLISLSLSNIKYKDWIKYSYKFQVLNLILTSLLLIIGLVIGY